METLIMKQKIRELSKSFVFMTPLTSPGSKHWVRLLPIATPVTQSQTWCVRVEKNINFTQDEFQSLDQVISYYASSSKHAKALANARKRVAHSMRKSDMPITIAMLRMQQGLSQSQVATLLGNSQSSYSLIESGQRDMLHKTFEKLITILRVSRDELAKAIEQTKQLTNEQDPATH